jgi:hypothetical protein
MANAGQRVAEYIVNLGAGTGLSDADREYAQEVVAGKITVSAETLKRLLKELKQGAQNKINRYKQTRSRVAKSLGKDGEAALAWFPEDFYVDDGPAPVRSSAAQSFLDSQ